MMQPSARVRACVLHVPRLFYVRIFVDAYTVTQTDDNLYLAVYMCVLLCLHCSAL